MGDLTDMLNRMAADLAALDVGPVLVDVRDVPVVRIAERYELCSDGDGLFEVWRARKPLLFNLDSERARDAVATLRRWTNTDPRTRENVGDKIMVDRLRDGLWRWCKYCRSHAATALLIERIDGHGETQTRYCEACGHGLSQERA